MLKQYTHSIFEHGCAQLKIGHYEDAVCLLSDLESAYKHGLLGNISAEKIIKELVTIVANAEKRMGAIDDVLSERN